MFQAVDATPIGELLRFISTYRLGGEDIMQWEHRLQTVHLLRTVGDLRMFRDKPEWDHFVQITGLPLKLAKEIEICAFVPQHYHTSGGISSQSGRCNSGDFGGDDGIKVDPQLMAQDPMAAVHTMADASELERLGDFQHLASLGAGANTLQVNLPASGSGQQQQQQPQQPQPQPFPAPAASPDTAIDVNLMELVQRQAPNFVYIDTVDQNSTQLWETVEDNNLFQIQVFSPLFNGAWATFVKHKFKVADLGSRVGACFHNAPFPRIFIHNKSNDPLVVDRIVLNTKERDPKNTQTFDLKLESGGPARQIRIPSKRSEELRLKFDKMQKETVVFNLLMAIRFEEQRHFANSSPNISPVTLRQNEHVCSLVDPLYLIGLSNPEKHIFPKLSINKNRRRSSEMIELILIMSTLENHKRPVIPLNEEVLPKDMARILEKIAFIKTEYMGRIRMDDVEDLNQRILSFIKLNSAQQLLQKQQHKTQSQQAQPSPQPQQPQQPQQQKITVHSAPVTPPLPMSPSSNSSDSSNSREIDQLFLPINDNEHRPFPQFVLDPITFSDVFTVSNAAVGGSIFDVFSAPSIVPTRHNATSEGDSSTDHFFNDVMAPSLDNGPPSLLNTSAAGSDTTSKKRRHAEIHDTCAEEMVLNFGLVEGGDSVIVIGNYFGQTPFLMSMVSVSFGPETNQAFIERISDENIFVITPPYSFPCQVEVAVRISGVQIPFSHPEFEYLTDESEYENRTRRIRRENRRKYNKRMQPNHGNIIPRFSSLSAADNSNSSSGSNGGSSFQSSQQALSAIASISSSESPSTTTTIPGSDLTFQNKAVLMKVEEQQELEDEGESIAESRPTNDPPDEEDNDQDEDGEEGVDAEESDVRPFEINADGVICLKRDACGQNLMHVASFLGVLPVVKYLAAYLGFNPNTRDHFGRTPLHLAFYRGNFDVANVLIENGADPQVSDIYGKTPIDMKINHLMTKATIADETRPSQPERKSEGDEEDDISDEEQEEPSTKRKYGSIFSRFSLLPSIVSRSTIAASNSATISMPDSPLVDSFFDVSKVNIKVAAVSDSIKRQRIDYKLVELSAILHQQQSRQQPLFTVLKETGLSSRALAKLQYDADSDVEALATALSQPADFKDYFFEKAVPIIEENNRRLIVEKHVFNAMDRYKILAALKKQWHRERSLPLRVFVSSVNDDSPGFHVKKTLTPQNYSGIQIGPYMFCWNNSGLIIPVPFRRDRVSVLYGDAIALPNTPEVIMEICRFAVTFNRHWAYNENISNYISRCGNCQYFVRKFMERMDVRPTWQPGGLIDDNISRIKNQPSILRSALKLWDPTGQEHTFRDETELARFVKDAIQTISDETVKRDLCTLTRSLCKCLRAKNAPNLKAVQDETGVFDADALASARRPLRPTR